MLVIYIKDLVITAKHGVHPSEQTTPQPFNVSVEISLTDTRATTSDDLHDTVDWSALRQLIIETVQNNSFALIERLAQEVARALLTDTRIKQVVVSIDKLEAFESGTPGVTLTMNQSASD